MSLKSSHAATVLIVAALSLGACDRRTVYHHYEHTPVAGWEKNDTLFFDIPHVTDRRVVEEEVELRITVDYPFRSLNLVVEQTTLPANIRRRDTLNCQLIDPDGNVEAGGVSLFQYRFRLTDLSLNEGDSLHVCIRHNMKREILPGIADVGLRLTGY